MTYDTEPPTNGFYMTPKDINANYSACVVEGQYPICTQPEKIVPGHKKLTRLVIRDPASTGSAEVTNQADCIQSIAKFDTKIVWTAGGSAQINLQPEPTVVQADSLQEEPYIFSRQAHRDVPYYHEYDSSNLFASLFGYNTRNWFNGIIGCLKPFWGILGQKEASSQGAYDDWEIPFEQIRDLQWLGSGAQGAVFMGNMQLNVVLIL